MFGLVCCSSSFWNLLGGCFFIILSALSSSNAISNDSPLPEIKKLLSDEQYVPRKNLLKYQKDVKGRSQLLIRI